MSRPALKEYQAQAVTYALKNHYSVLALDPGLGKSRCAIEVREVWKLNCLVICPSYLILNWVKEIKKWAPEARVTTFRSGKQICEVVCDDYVITSYDLVQKAEHLFEWADLVVLDEAHAIKSMKAKRSTFIHKNIFENSIKHVLLLTGTPIKNRVQEFYSLLALCHYNPTIAEGHFFDLYPSEIDFADQFSFRESYDITLDDGRRIPIVKWVGLRNVAQLKTHLHGKYIRIRSSDVLDLPPVIYKDFQTSDDDDLDLINAFNSFFLDEDFEDKEMLAREERTSSVLPEHKKVAAIKKVPFTIKYIENLLEETDCALVYSDHVESAEKIAAHFNVTALTGKVSSTRRSQMADDFQSGQGNLLVCTVGAMKEGKDLFRSKHIVFNDLPWVPGDLKQVIYRIQRIGQTGTCTIHKILGSPQDAYISEALVEKMEVIERAT